MANDFVDKADLASTAHGKGASTVGIEDAGGRIAADNVEDALQEILTVATDAAADIGTKATSAQLASEAHGAGAALIGIEDSANNFAGGNVEAALTQLANTTEDHETRIAFNETDITTLFEEVGLKQTTSDLSSTAHGSGASQVGIEDASGLFTSTTVEGALHELAIGGGGGGDATLAMLASHAGGEGASLIGIQDVGGLITATQTEGALAEIVVKANTGITNAATAQSTANAAMPTATLASTTLGQGASLVGVHDTAGIITATTAEGAFAEIAANVALRPLTADLASTLISKGASLIGINDTGSLFTSTQVEAALQELAAKSAPAGYFATNIGNTNLYVAPWGDNTNDGYDWRTPKKTILTSPLYPGIGAYDSLPDLNGGIINFADGTYIGGTLSKQGLLITGTLGGNIIGTNTDNVVGSTKTWTIANGNFLPGDVGGSIAILAPSGGPNYFISFIIVSVTNSTTIVTSGTPVDETFTTSTVINLIRPLINANMPPGWRRFKPLHLKGHNPAPIGGEVQFSALAATLIPGNPGDGAAYFSPDSQYTIWITANIGDGGQAFVIENVQSNTLPGGIRIGGNPDPAVAPFGPQGMGSDYTTALWWIKNCAFQWNGGMAPGSGQPMCHIGYVIWGYIDNCSFVPSLDEPFDSDRRAGMLVKPSDGSSQVLIKNCRGGQGGLKFYAGSSSWYINVDFYQIESDFVHPLPPAVWLIGANKFGSGIINTANAADGTVGSMNSVKIESGAGYKASQVTVFNSGIPDGPCVVMSTGGSSDGVVGPVLSPAGGYVQGFAGGQLWAEQDFVRQVTPVISNMVSNILPSRASANGLTGAIENPTTLGHSANRIWTQAGAVAGIGSDTVIDAPIVGKAGGNTGIQLTSSGGSCFQRLFLKVQSVSVDDVWIVGIWVKYPSFTGSPIALNISDSGGSGLVTTVLGDEQITYQGGQWSYLKQIVKVTSVGTNVNVLVNYAVTAIQPGFPVIIDQPLLIKIPAGTISDSELGALFQNLASYVQAPPGVASTQPGQMLIAQGGLGVGNAIASGITLSSTTKLMEVFSAHGVPLGFLEIKQELAPGTPKIYFDSQNVDTLSNTTVTDGEELASATPGPAIPWKNVGSLVAAANMLTVDDGFGDHAPLFHEFAGDNKIKNQSSVISINEDKMVSSAFTAIPQPYNVIALFRNSQAAGVNPATLISRGPANTGPALIEFAATTYNLIVNAGTPVNTGIAPSQDTFHTLAVTFNGASSTGELDGVSLGTFNAGAASLDQIGIFSVNTSYFYGDLVALMVYDDGTSRADAVAFLTRKYGSTPQ